MDLRCGVEVAAVTGAEGRVTGVKLGDGSRLDADLVLAGVGITPNAYLAEDAGLEIDNGILMNERLQTSDPAIYAAGDVANAYHPFLRRTVRVEHWANARRQGATAAKAMLGQAAVYDRLPYFFSDQYDVGMEYTGFVDPAGYDEIVFRGDVARREFAAFWLADGRVLAGMNANVWDVAGNIEKLITSRRQVDPRRLADASVPLETL